MIFKIKLMYDIKKVSKDILKKLENQEEKTFNVNGRMVEIGKANEEKQAPTSSPKPKPKATAKKIKASKGHKKK